MKCGSALTKATDILSTSQSRLVQPPNLQAIIKVQYRLLLALTRNKKTYQMMHNHAYDTNALSFFDGPTSYVRHTSDARGLIYFLFASKEIRWKSISRSRAWHHQDRAQPKTRSNQYADYATSKIDIKTNTWTCWTWTEPREILIFRREK